MTEQEWLECRNPGKMLDHLRYSKRHRPSFRKMRLLACARCRSDGALLTDERLLRAVETSERFADGIASQNELRTAKRPAQSWTRAIEQASTRFSRKIVSAIPAVGLQEAMALFQGDDYQTALRKCRLARAATESAALQIKDVVREAVWASFGGASAEDRTKYCSVVRELFGNPFRPYQAPSSWPSSVISLAEAAYQQEPCHFALHDALLEAGHEELAAHFVEAYHPKGCWAIDAILGRT